MTGEPVVCAVDPAVQAEFPELRLWSRRCRAADGPSLPGVRERLRALSDRFGGAQAVQLRTQPVPHAYRVFYRHIGFDPDARRTPIEAAVLERLERGRFPARGRVEDALLVALVETGVPVWALDDDAVQGELRLRPAVAGERLGRGEHASDARPGRLVVADDAGPAAELFGPVAPGYGVMRATTALRLFAVQVKGVPAIHVDEALWLAGEALEALDA